MPENISPHWTEDDDLLTEYVLGRVSDAERRRLEEHLGTCARCSETVERERAIVAGVRQYARESLKTRLKNRITAQSSSSQRFGTWQRVASLVAVLTIIFGVGLYNGWFPWQERGGVSGQQTMQSPEKSAGETDRNRPELKETESAKDERQVQQGMRYEEEAKVGPPPGLKRSHEVIAAAPKEDVEKLDQVGKAQAQETYRTGAGGESKQKGAVSLSETRNAAVPPENEPLWIEGEVKGRSFATPETQSVQKPSVDAQFQGAKSEGLTTHQMARKSPVTSRGENEISLHQQPLRDLPARRQQMQLADKRIVQARVEQSGDKLDVTIFLDTLFDADEFKSARVEQPTPDSLVVGVASEEIAFKLPRSVQKMQKVLKQGTNK